MVLGIALLANITIVTAYLPTSPAHRIISGLGPFNSSSVSTVDPNLLTLVFLSYTLGFLTDRTSVLSIPASTQQCNSSNECLSYLLTGGLYRTIPDPSNLTNEEINGGTIYIVEIAPGYLLAYSLGQKHIFQWSDCRIYPAGLTALAFCLKNSNDDLIAGKSLQRQTIMGRMEGLSR